MKKDEETIVEIGAEGGSLRLTRFIGPDGEWKFVAYIDETALEDFIAENDREGLVFASSSPELDDFAEAFQRFYIYPWYALYPLNLHPDYGTLVLDEVLRLGGKEELDRWMNTLVGPDEEE